MADRHDGTRRGAPAVNSRPLAPADRGRGPAPRLRAITSPRPRPTATEREPILPPRLRIVGGRPRISLAGGSAALRAEVRRELAGIQPDAIVGEADEVWELLQQAPAARLVLFVGDLEDAPARSVARLLAHRHPDLRVADAWTGDAVSRPPLRPTLGGAPVIELSSGRARRAARRIRSASRPTRSVSSGPAQPASQT